MQKNSSYALFIALTFLASSPVFKMHASQAVRDLKADLASPSPDLVKTLQDGIAVQSFYATQPQNFATYNVGLDTLFEKKFNMTFSDITSLMNNKGLNAADTITYLQQHSQASVDVNAQKTVSAALDTLSSATGSFDANIIPFVQASLQYGSDTNAFQYSNNAATLKKAQDFFNPATCYLPYLRGFYDQVIVAVAGNTNLNGWGVVADANPTQQSIVANAGKLQSVLKTLNPKSGTPLSSLRDTLNPTVGAGWFDWLTGGNDEALFLTFADGTSGRKDTNYLKDESKYSRFIGGMMDLIVDCCQTAFKGDSSFEGSPAKVENRQTWLDAHKFGDEKDANGLAPLLLNKINNLVAATNNQQCPSAETVTALNNLEQSILGLHNLLVSTQGNFASTAQKNPAIKSDYDQIIRQFNNIVDQTFKVYGSIDSKYLPADINNLKMLNVLP